MIDMGGLGREVTPQGCRESGTFTPALTHGAVCRSTCPFDRFDRFDKLKALRPSKGRLMAPRSSSGYFEVG